MQAISLLLLTLSASVSAQSLNTHYTGQTKKGLDFIMTGDYGVMYDFLFQAKRSFQSMDDLLGSASNETNPRDLIDFLIAGGDNLYPIIAEHPQDWEFDRLLELFQTDNLKNIDVFAVRGNHDCKFRRERELELSEQYAHWVMPYYYYKQEYEIGNGKKLGILYIDTCFMLCSTYSYKDDAFTGSSSCSEEDIQFGNEQYDWIKQVMEEWDQDESIVWKASVQHHMLFGKHYTDKQEIIDNYLPLLFKHQFDFYFNGHEHILLYANYPYEMETRLENPPTLSEEDCHYMREIFFEDEETYKEYKQGEWIHQFTSGLTGSPGYKLCEDLPTAGYMQYAQNIYLGWAQVHVDEDEAVVKFRGIEPLSRKLFDLYEVKVTARDKAVASS